MRFMNDYDLHHARQRFGYGNTPNRLALVMVVDNLREWANQNSDGWAYWPKPTRAADKAMQLIESRTTELNRAQEREDITDAEMRSAVAPIKAFMTRQKVDPRDREIILRATEVHA